MQDRQTYYPKLFICLPMQSYRRANIVRLAVASLVSFVSPQFLPVNNAPRMMLNLNPQVDSPLFAATAAAAVPLQLYHKDPVHQPLGLSLNSVKLRAFKIQFKSTLVCTNFVTLIPVPEKDNKLYFE